VSPGVQLDPAQQHQDEKDDQDHPDDAARAVTPATAVRPSWNYAEQRQDQDDEQYCSE
jgi:hypothetical protein